MIIDNVRGKTLQWLTGVVIKGYKQQDFPNPDIFSACANEGSENKTKTIITLHCSLGEKKFPKDLKVRSR